MNGWNPNSVALPVQSTTLSGVVTAQPVSREYAVTAGGSLNHVVKVTASSATVVGTISAILQTAIGSDWVSTKSMSITAAGNFYIKLAVEVAADQTYLPLLAKCRVVVTTTNAGDAVTVSAVEVLQEL